MFRRSSILLAILIFAASAFAAEDGRENPEPKKGFVSRIFGIFGGSKSKDKKSKKVVGRLEMSMEVSPLPVDLSKTRRLEVVLKLSNRSRKVVQLEFPTTQRIEILIRRTDDKLVTQWSEDQAFATVAGIVAINPGERIQYTASISTRDLEAGKEYILEGFFPHYDELKAQQKIVPEA